MSNDLDGRTDFTDRIIALQGRLSAISGHTGLGLLLIAVVAVATLAVGPRFLGVGNLQSMAVQIPEFGLLSIAMMVTLLKGGLNLSIVATANLCALTVAGVLTAWGTGLEGLPSLAVILAALAAGLLVAIAVGVLNGALVAYIGLSPIIATLGTMILLKGLAVGFSRGGVISGFPDALLFLGQGQIFSVPVSLVMFLLVAGLLGLFLRHTAFGASLYMIGSNEAATRYSGVDTKRVMLQCYVLSSLFAFLAGLVMMARFNSANAAYGESYLLVTVLAAVLGGVNPLGGSGRVGGLLLSLAILQVIQSALNQLTVSPFLTLAIWGGLLIVVSAIAAKLTPARH